MPVDHLLARLAVGMPGWCWNDAFRAVHDLIGHAVTGFQFGPVGEFGALFHSLANARRTAAGSFAITAR